MLKYRATAAHFTPIGLPCSKIALTRSFYTTAVAIAVRKLVGAEHEDVVTYEKSFESLASFDLYAGRPHEIKPISKDCNYDTFRKHYICDFSSLERRVSGLGYTHQI